MDKLWAIDMQFAVAVVFFALSVGFVLPVSIANKLLSAVLSRWPGAADEPERPANDPP